MTPLTLVLLQFGSRFACLETAEEETRISPHGLGRMPSLRHRVVHECRPVRLSTAGVAPGGAEEVPLARRRRQFRRRIACPGELCGDGRSKAHPAPAGAGGNVAAAR